MKIYNYNLWDGECEIFNVENLVVFLSNINSLYYADEVNYFPYKSFKELSVEEIEIIRKEML